MRENNPEKNILWFEDNKKLKLKLRELKTRSRITKISEELSIRGIGSKSWLGINLHKLHVHLDLGYTHYISSQVPAGIEPLVRKTRMIFSSSSKEELGNFTSSVRVLKKPDPYKGKGIRRKGEEIKLKVGKVKT